MIPQGTPDIELLTKEELEKLYKNHPEKTLQEQRDKVILGLLIYQGITTGELRNLATYDYSPVLLTIEIRKSLKGEYRRLKLTNGQNESIIYAKCNRWQAIDM